jgi:peroxiredoxin
MQKLIFILLLAATSAQAQQIQNFSLPNVNDGATVELNQFTSTSGIVVVFTSNECPYDNYYKDRLKKLIEQYKGKIQFVLINSSNDAEESTEKMAIHYTDLGIPYLADKEQKAVENFGARKSPEVFLVSPQLNVIYSGAIDDNPQVATDTKQNYLKDAIDKFLAGQKIEVTNNRVLGCTIKKK